MTSKINKNTIPTLLSIRDFTKKHPFMTENSIRWMLYKDVAGIEDCLVRVSSRIYIDEERFFDFLTKRKEQKDEGGLER